MTRAQAPTGQDEVEIEQEGDQVTKPSDLGFPTREIEVQPVEMPKNVDNDGMVQVRMGRTIEEFTYGNPHIHYKLEAGKIYRVPGYIAQYLYSLEALSSFA